MDKPSTLSLPPIFLNETQVAERQGRSVRTLQAERLKGGGIPFVKFGRAVRYRLTDVIAFENAHVRQSTSDTREGGTDA
jgi:hypothetical protein